MKLIKAQNYSELSARGYEIFKSVLQNTQNPTVGLATGSTPIGFYAEAVADYNCGNVSFCRATAFNLDEYVGLDKSCKDSYAAYMQKHLFSRTDFCASNVHIPCATGDLKANCARYDNLLDACPRDFQLLGMGSNGHIGFCEPNTPYDLRTHLVTLSQSTIQANSRFFAEGKMPAQALTMGLCDILSAKKILLLVCGKSKAKALKTLFNSGVSAAFPASYLLTHPDCTVIADTDALCLLDQTDCDLTLV